MSLTDIETFSDAAGILGVTPKALMWWLYKSAPSGRYKRFAIKKKSGGFREIESPCLPIRKMQMALRSRLEQHHKPYASVHAYVRRHSIVTNAERHRNSGWIFNLDLEDFFGTVTFPRVFGLLRAHPLSAQKNIAAIFAQLLTHNGRLPQGAPTSPTVANMIAHRMDKQLTRLAKDLHCRYTRYGDDLTFSSRHPIAPPDIVAPGALPGPARPGERLVEIVRRNGFRPNYQKAWLQRPWQGMIVTGLSVGKAVRVRSTYKRRLRAILHSARTKGLDAAEQRFREFDAAHSRYPRIDPPVFSDVLRGKIEFVGMVQGIANREYQDLLHAYAAVFPDQKRPRKMLSSETQFDFFLCHSSHDKDKWARPLRHALGALNHTCWFDEEQILKGASIPIYINDGLRRSTILVAVISPSFLSKTWTQTEMGAVLYRETQENAIRVVPVVVGGEDSRSLFAQQLPIVAQKNYIAWEDEGMVDAVAKQLSDSLGGFRPGIR